MRKVTIFAAPILALALVSALWPTAHPDVDRLGDNVYETIWLWRIPAYANNPAWRVRWSFSDPLRAEARCCRAVQPASGDRRAFANSVNRQWIASASGWLKPAIPFPPGNSPRSLGGPRARGRTLLTNSFLKIVRLTVNSGHWSSGQLRADLFGAYWIMRLLKLPNPARLRTEDWIAHDQTLHGWPVVLW